MLSGENGIFYLTDFAIAKLSVLTRNCKQKLSRKRKENMHHL
ncbi:unnamed protein product [Larinioides sclopetarius]|uniref:Uncharacterized protein n=1 Tax=Larinioides sclopetarius TaxID=280406 RepID=A0AAV2AX64_9ARAC